MLAFACAAPSPQTYFASDAVYPLATAYSAFPYYAYSQYPYTGAGLYNYAYRAPSYYTYSSPLLV